MSANFTPMTTGQVARFAVSCWEFAPTAFPQTAYVVNQTELERAIACLAQRGIEVVTQTGDQRSITFFSADDPDCYPLDPQTLE